MATEEKMPATQVGTINQKEDLLQMDTHSRSSETTAAPVATLELRLVDKVRLESEKSPGLNKVPQRTDKEMTPMKEEG